VAHNDSTATSALANVALPQSTPQIAGIAVANAAPVMQNNIIYNNRSFYRDGTEETVPGQPQFGLGQLHPATDHPSGLYSLDTWDVGVFGAVGTANPDYCLLTTLTGTMGGVAFNHNDGTNIVADPVFVSPYFTGLTSAQAGDEGGNFVNVFPSPLTTEGSDYHIGGGSPAFDSGTAVAFPELADDFDNEPRPQGAAPDLGADERATAFNPGIIGVYRNGTWYFDANGNGAWNPGIDTVYPSFGLAGDLPVTGDWNGDGTLEIGVYNNGAWSLDANGNGALDAGDTLYAGFGLAGDLPVAGDWDGDGTFEIGVFRNGRWYLDANGNGAWDPGTDTLYTSFGLAGDIPVTGN